MSKYGNFAVCLQRATWFLAWAGPDGVRDSASEK